MQCEQREKHQISNYGVNVHKQEEWKKSVITLGDGQVGARKNQVDGKVEWILKDAQRNAFDDRFYIF